MSMPVLAFKMFEPADLIAIDAGSHHPDLSNRLARLALAEKIATHGRAWSIRARTGTLLMICGVIEPHPHHLQLWAITAPESRLYMTALTRAVRHFLDRQAHRRIDCNVRESFAAGRRWMALLGFGAEATLAHFFPDGEAAVIYRKVAS